MMKHDVDSFDVFSSCLDGCYGIFEYRIPCRVKVLVSTSISTELQIQ